MPAASIVTPACFTNVRRSISVLAFSAIAINSRFLDRRVVWKSQRKGKGLNRAAQSHQRSHLFYAVRPNHERTLAHENIRKQGKFPNTAEISLDEQNGRVAPDDPFFPSDEKIRIWSSSYGFAQSPLETRPPTYAGS